MNLLCSLGLHKLRLVQTDPEDPLPDHYECARCPLVSPIYTHDGEGRSE